MKIGVPLWICDNTTLFRVLQPHAESMLSRITNNASALLKTIWMIRNNQNAHPKKFQRFVSSNLFMNITSRAKRN